MAIPYSRLLKEQLKQTKNAAGLLNETIEKGIANNLSDKELKNALFKSLKRIIKAHGSEKIATKAGLKFSSIYNMISDRGNPNITNMLKLFRGLDLAIQWQPTDQAEKNPVDQNIDSAS